MAKVDCEIKVAAVSYDEMDTDKLKENRRRSDPLIFAKEEKREEKGRGRRPSGLYVKPASRKRTRSMSERGQHRSSSVSTIPTKKRCHGSSNWKGSRHNARKIEKFASLKNFLLGGNIRDPLNLNSLNEEAVDKELNAETPVSSPLPTPAHRRNVPVRIPPNMTDPLNLNEEPDHPMLGQQKRKRHRHKKKRAGESEPAEIEASTPVAAKTTPSAQNKSPGSKLDRIIDQIVSPVIPQGPEWPKRKRRRTGSESDDGAQKKAPPKKVKSPHRAVVKRPLGSQGPSLKGKQNDPKRFRYGNYNQYYGKRNPEAEEDHRIKYFRLEWMSGKDVLDIGCNVGHVSLTIASRMDAKRVVGTDIDNQLISVAKRNIRHYIQEPDLTRFPISCVKTYGPLPSNTEDGRKKFPNNIHFQQGNYVPESDDELEMTVEEFDTILALSVSKWLQLNYGDAGLKRAFKKMFRQLRPGGVLLLEPQNWASYKKRKNLTPEIRHNYDNSTFRPPHFSRYLLSTEVGFSRCDLLDTPYNRSKGFQRPIYVFTKSSADPFGSHPPSVSGSFALATPALPEILGSNFFFGSGSNTPSTPGLQKSSTPSTPMLPPATPSTPKDKQSDAPSSRDHPPNGDLPNGDLCNGYGSDSSSDCSCSSCCSGEKSS